MVKPEQSETDSECYRVSADAASKCTPHERVMEIVNDYSRYCEDVKDVSLKQLHAVGKFIQFKSEMWRLASVAVGNLAAFGGRALVKEHKTSEANPGVRALRAYHDARRDSASNFVFETVANDMLKHMEGHSKALVRCFVKGLPGAAIYVRRIDALLTSKYGIIDNQWFVNVLGGIAKGKWASFRFNGRLISGNYLISDEVRTEEAEYGAALAVANAEDGRASLTIRPSVFDWLSGAGVVFGAMEGELMRRVHKGNIEAATLRRTINDHVQAQLPLIDTCIQHVNDLKEIALATEKLKHVLFDVGERNGMTLDERVEWLTQVEVELATRCEKLGLSAYALVMGLTRLAGNKAMNDERSMELSLLAGRLATPKRGSLKTLWESIRDQAATADSAKVEEVFAK